MYSVDYFEIHWEVFQKKPDHFMFQKVYCHVIQKTQILGPNKTNKCQIQYDATS